MPWENMYSVRSLIEPRLIQLGGRRRDGLRSLILNIADNRAPLVRSELSVKCAFLRGKAASACAYQ